MDQIEGRRGLIRWLYYCRDEKEIGVPAARALADFLPTLSIKAKDFATELTSHNVVEKDLQGEKKITREHIDNNLAVRDMLKKRGVSPETLLPAEDVTKLKRKLENEERKILQKEKKAKKKG